MELADYALYIVALTPIVALICFFLLVKDGEYTEEYNKYFETREKTFLNRIKGGIRACFVIYFHSFLGAFVLCTLPLVLVEECTCSGSDYENYEQYEHRPDHF
jgi:hypothetical protein